MNFIKNKKHSCYTNKKLVCRIDMALNKQDRKMLYVAF